LKVQHGDLARSGILAAPNRVRHTERKRLDLDTLRRPFGRFPFDARIEQQQIAYAEKRPVFQPFEAAQLPMRGHRSLLATRLVVVFPTA
jgi:hypothetical protein